MPVKGNFREAEAIDKLEFSPFLRELRLAQECSSGLVTLREASTSSNAPVVKCEPRGKQTTTNPRQRRRDGVSALLTSRYPPARCAEHTDAPCSLADPMQGAFRW